MAFLNRRHQSRPVRFRWQATPVADEVTKAQLNARPTTCRLRNLWTHQPAGTTRKPFTATAPAHDIVLLLSK